MLNGTAQQYDSSVMARYAPDLMKDRFQTSTMMKLMRPKAPGRFDKHDL